MIFFIWLVTAITVLAVYLYQKYSKLSKLGVNHVPVIAPFGHLTWALLRMEHIIHSMMRNCDQFPDDRVVGQYEILTPIFVIKDLELIKNIAVKDFEHFVDRRGFIDEFDPLFGRNLLLLKGDEWKAMRSTLSPAFTSSKIKLMVPFMVEVGEEMIISLKDKIKNSGKVYIDVEAKDLTTRYANDVIASCAFGLKVQSHTNDNQFYTMCKDVSTFNYKRLLKVFTFRCFPKIATKLKLTLSSPEAAKFFREVVLTTMKEREENNIIRNDMIHLLLNIKKEQMLRYASDNNAETINKESEDSTNAQKHHNIDWTDTDLIAQAVLFLFAGFDTVSTAMSFLLHELAVNPDVQDRLVQEIRENESKNGGKLDYNIISNLTYLDMVVSEILRMWPVAPMIDRSCVKDFNLGKPNKNAEKDCIVRAGDCIAFPIWALHRSSEYFPNPMKFDPERFSEKNKHNIKPFTYLPFGLGPRNCIGSRFALCEMKVMLYQIIQHMEVYPCERTSVPAELTTDGFNMRIKGGAWVRIRVRE